ncbi:MAG TPA: asparagine synthase (glutamine-hydrolyzing) [Planctomycetota bacterium]
MCGFAGSIGAIGPQLIRAVQAAASAQRHRGPDDAGTWLSGGPGQDGAVLAFRRLAIIDLSPDGHQPMVDPVTGNAIAFNGEIYNFHDLRRELEAGGATFRSRGDTEVVLQAYARWGVRALSRLCGMFAFAIWDARRRCMVLARDRLGIKPLYLCEVTQPEGCRAVLFASELRALLATGLVPRRLARAAVARYVWNGFVTGPGTIIEGVRMLPPATVVTLNARGECSGTELYWRLPSSRPAADGVAKLQDELRTVVRQHLISDVPLAVFLSGGIDSSAVAALAARAGSTTGRLRTFHVAFDEQQYDETRYAHRVAAALGTHHAEVRLTQQRFLDLLEPALRSIDQPTFDGINTYFVSRAVRDAGITVALSGVGGDELFGGYRSFRDIPRAARFARLARVVPGGALRMLARGLLRARYGVRRAVPPQTRWGKVADVLATRGRLVELYQTCYGLFSAEFARQLVVRDDAPSQRCGMPLDRLEELQDLAGDAATPHAVSVLEMANFVGERLLRDTDAASMAASLETRVPLLDHRVVEAVANVPERERFEPLGNKMLLRQLAMPELDAALFDRPKAGFVLPLDVWLRQRLAKEVEGVLRDRGLCDACGLDARVVGNLWDSFRARASGLYWSRVWALFVLAWWAREHRASV